MYVSCPPKGHAQYIHNIVIMYVVIIIIIFEAGRRIPLLSSTLSLILMAMSHYYSVFSIGMIQCS